MNDAPKEKKGLQGSKIKSNATLEATTKKNYPCRQRLLDATTGGSIATAEEDKKGQIFCRSNRTQGLSHPGRRQSKTADQHPSKDDGDVGRVIHNNDDDEGRDDKLKR